MWTIVLDILGIIGGAGAVVVGMSAWLGKVWADRILQNEINKHNIAIAELTANLQKEIDRSKTQLDIIKESSVRYSEFQFKLYNELWGELYNLKVISDALWEKADNSNLTRLVNQLKKTNEQIKKNALLIEEEHLSELFVLLNQFGNYQVGKRSLIELRANAQDIYM
ncbi:MAG: hypothetical protein ACYCYE_18830 [Clostridia bacterium]